MDVSAYPLPYHVKKGGLFLKDAAVLSGLGIIGKNNLLLHPAWGPRIRLRSILMDGDGQVIHRWIVDRKSLEFLIDTGADYTVICPDHKMVLGFDDTGQTLTNIQ